MNENSFDKIGQFNNQENLNTTIKLATIDDWEDYKRIRLEVIENEPVAFYVTKYSKEKENNKSENEWKNELQETDSFIVLSKNNNTPIGMARAFVRNEEENQWHVASVYLNKNFRGSGCGKKIMNSILDEIKNRNGKIVTLSVIDTQEIAVKVYEKLGFKISSKFEKNIIGGTEYPGGLRMIKEM